MSYFDWFLVLETSEVELFESQRVGEGENQMQASSLLYNCIISSTSLGPFVSIRVFGLWLGLYY